VTGGLSSPGNQCSVEFTGKIPSDWRGWPGSIVFVKINSTLTVPGRRSALEMTSSIAPQHDNWIGEPKFWRASIEIGLKSVVLNTIESGSPRMSIAPAGSVFIRGFEDPVRAIERN